VSKKVDYAKKKKNKDQIKFFKKLIILIYGDLWESLEWILNSKNSLGPSFLYNYNFVI
jgi:hypothetical protein